MSGCHEQTKDLLIQFYDRHDLAMTYFEDGAPSQAGELLLEAANICAELAKARAAYVDALQSPAPHTAEV